MIFTNIETEQNNLLDPKFMTAFGFLKRDDLSSLAEGWYELENGVRASVQRYETLPESELSFETHEKFFDVQYLVEGREFIGVCTRRVLKEKTPYDGGNDVTFYEEPAYAGKVLLEAGDFVVLAPEDAHKPRCAVVNRQPVIKIVIKVPTH